MIDKTEAQPEALRLEIHQECADFATSLRSAANVVQLQGQKAPPSFLKAADLFEQAASEIQQLKDQLADETESASEWRRLALQFDGHRMQALSHLRFLTKHPSDHCAAAVNFLAAPPLSGEQVLADRLAQLSPRQAAPDRWRLVPAQPTQAMCDAAKYTVHAGLSVFKWADGYHAMLTAAPPSPAREPLSDEQIEKLRKNTFSTDNPFCPCDRKTMQKAVWAAERAHGIGATNG